MQTAIQGQALAPDSLSTLFEKQLLQRIIPFWEGTKWSFEGHTPKPKDGEIACGYFVSTTLRDAGLVINRYRLAQQSPINEARTLAFGNKLLVIETSSVAESIAIVRDTLTEGMHFVGFDESHVGFLLKMGEEVYLIHSNYLGAKGVEIEEISASEVFAAYRKFYLVALSNNAALLKSWKDKVEVPVE